VTLIELLMAISIMGIILVTLGFAVTQGFRNATTTKVSIDRSILGNFAARYFAADIASTTYGSTSVVTSSPPACGAGNLQTIIDIQTGANTAVSYAILTLADGTKSLVRTSCSGSVTGTLTQLSRRHLGTTDGNLTASATCATTTSCALTLLWTSPTYSITFSGTRWVNATTTT
jgi:type II secretory pathway pseudopilin PulG